MKYNMFQQGSLRKNNMELSKTGRKYSMECESCSERI